MADEHISNRDDSDHSEGRAFRSPALESVRQAGNVLTLDGGQIVLPDVFGFCRGVERALEMLDLAVESHRAAGTQLFLLGEIIHNPWVNRYFQNRGVTALSSLQSHEPEKYIKPDDCAVVPAFGVPLAIQRRLEQIGCEVVDTTCGDVRRLWKWAHQAAVDGHGVLIFGRATHDETLVTKSRLGDIGGKYVVAGNLQQVRVFGQLITAQAGTEQFREAFGPEATNSESLCDFERLAQVSQTTMLYSETLQVRDILTEAFAGRFGDDATSERLCFQPTVCRATQARQTAAVEMCRRTDCDLVIVVGGFGSSNTRHLFELACDYAPSYFIETVDNIISADELSTFDFKTDRPIIASNWLPPERPLRIGMLAGASSPEIVLGEVLERLAELLG